MPSSKPPNRNQPKRTDFPETAPNSRPDLPSSTPPKFPDDEKAFNRAAFLLGFRARGDELQIGAREEMVRLIGLYPAPETAVMWRAAMRKIRRIRFPRGNCTAT